MLALKKMIDRLLKDNFEQKKTLKDYKASIAKLQQQYTQLKAEQAAKAKDTEKKNLEEANADLKEELKEWKLKFQVLSKQYKAGGEAFSQHLNKEMAKIQELELFGLPAETYDPALLNNSYLGESDHRTPSMRELERRFEAGESEEDDKNIVEKLMGEL